MPRQRLDSLDAHVTRVEGCDKRVSEAVSALEAASGDIRVFEPQVDVVRADALYADWKRAVERSLGWEE